MSSRSDDVPSSMRAWVTDAPGHVRLEQREVPTPGPGELLVRIEACGVCRTDLHVVDRELDVHRPGVVPGHQGVGSVVSGTRAVPAGTRVGIPWLRMSCGACQYCRSGRENLCPNCLFTGWDADGAFAEFATVPEAYCYALPDDVDPVAIAPLLCAGIIGYRALERSALPAGGRLGIYGFGSSGHITAQVAMAAGAEVFVMTRGERNQALARSLGIDFVADEAAQPPEPLDSAIIFAPAGNLVPVALRAVAAGGTVVTAGIHMSDIPTMVYEDTIFHERDLRTVTANTRADGAALLRLARTLRLRPEVTVYPFDQTDRALADLRAGNSSGSLVVRL